MNKKKLESLNRSFIEFGLTPHNDLNYKWGHTRDMSYLVEEDTRIVNPTGSGLFLATKHYTQHAYADIYQSGWCICRWEPVVSFEAWRAQYGESIPWPKHGNYIPMDSTFLPTGMDPNEDITAYAASKIRDHLNTRLRDFAERAVLAVEREKARRIATTSDFIDDQMTTYGNVPGTKGHVLFPQREPIRMEKPQ